MKRWVQIFKALANINRVKIVGLLAHRETMNVTDIAAVLDISLKATSKHLIILDNLDVLSSRGKDSRVFYALNRAMPKDLWAAVKLFL